MSLEEIKEEYKQSEGDPHIKGRIRQLRHARMKKRMMAAVPTASVIITNPTHYSVALKTRSRHVRADLRRQGRRSDGIQDQEIATANNIPIVENVPLACALHRQWRSMMKSRSNTTMPWPK
jgi:flagellar biosynthetic protein FlhB